MIMKIPETGFYFDEEKHVYWLDGKRMTGVTTILGVLAKPALISWASKEACEYVRQNLKLFEDLEAVLEKAKNAYAQKRDKAADIGTLAHSLVETYIKTNNFTPTGNEQIDAMVTQFIVWSQVNKVEFLNSEKVVWSREHFYGGKYDFTCKIDDKTYLGDYKTGSGIYFEMFLQCAGYQLALLEQEPETKIDGHIIVNTTKDGKFNTETHYDYTATKEGFLAALKLYRLLNTKLE